jgi:hypothetical protein
MSETQAPAGEGQLNTKRGSQVVVHYKPTQLYFRPETGELLLIPTADAGEFEVHGKEMCKAVDDLHLANIAMSNAISRYAEQYDASDPSDRVSAKSAVETARKKLDQANTALHEKIKPLGTIATSGKSIVELIPIRKLTNGGRPVTDKNGKQLQRQYGKKMTFVRSDKIKSHWRTYDLTSKADTQSGHKSVLTKDANGKNKIDISKLQKQIKEIKPKIKAEFFDFDEHLVSGVLGDWAAAWNKTLHYDHQGIGSFGTNNVDVSAQAQLMRYMAGVGATAEWAPLEGKAGFKAEAKGEFALAEAKGCMTLYVPDRIGWVLQFTGKKGVVYPLGAIRGQFGLALSGVAGASAVAELGAEIALSPKTVGYKGVPCPPKKLFAMDKDSGIEIGGKEAEITPLKGELGVFAGARADAELSGAVQWLNPENTKKEFKNFVKLAPGVSGMLGAGGSAKFEVSYKDGKFRIVMAASLCVGLGARGKIGCEADAVLAEEFIVWFFYQLYHANYEFLEFVEKDAFDTIKNIQFMMIHSGKKIEAFMDQTVGLVQRHTEKLLLDFANSQKRDDLAARILTQPPMLRHSTPETKGMLIYQLTRHGKADWIDVGNYAGGDPYGRRKRAVIAILCWVQTRAEWDNVFQHMTALGDVTEDDMRGHVKRFLNLGIDMSDELNRIEVRLKFNPTRGYAITMNDSHEYRMYTMDNRYFAMAERLEPLNGAGSNVDAGLA